MADPDDHAFCREQANLLAVRGTNTHFQCKHCKTELWGTVSRFREHLGKCQMAPKDVQERLQEIATRKRSAAAAGAAPEPAQAPKKPAVHQATLAEIKARGDKANRDAAVRPALLVMHAAAFHS